MALSEKTVNRHNLRRADVFAANGLNNMDVQYAHPHFEGYGHGTCSLCGKQHLKWLFSIKFDVPSGIVALAKVFTDITRDKEVTLQPVGSKCIVDWLDAVPESAEKLEALRRWETEMKRCKQAMKAKVVEDLCRQAGFDTPQDAFDAYQATSSAARWKLPYKSRRRLANNAYGIRHKRVSRGTAKLWLEGLAECQRIQAELDAAETGAATPEVAAEPEPTTPALSQEDAEIVERGRVAWANRSVLRDYQRRDFEDIGRKVVKFGSFRSSAQRRYYADMLRRMEDAPQ
jgi:hypothetical protein